MSRRTLVTVGLVLVFAMVVAGCRRKRSSTTIVKSPGADIFTTDAFPGASVQDHNVADDKRAMSQSGETVGGFRVIFNGDRCQAMAMYETDAGLFAQHWDGESWTPPVALRGLDQVTTVGSAVGVICAFINTENHSSESARARDGDCIIAYHAFDTGVTAADGVNNCVWIHYFDVTFDNDAGRNFGFQEYSDRVSSDDAVDEDAITLGLATDAIRGRAIWVTSAAQYDYGDPMTGLQVIWTQREDNDGAPPYDDVALHAVFLNPAEALPDDVPLTPSADTRLTMSTFGASDIGTSSEETLVSESNFRTYNNQVFFVTGADNATAGDDSVDIPTLSNFGDPLDPNDDHAIQVIAFDLATGTAGTPTSLHLTMPIATDTVENDAEFLYSGYALTNGAALYQDIFGSDEGLACTVIFHAQLVSDPDGEMDYGDPANDAQLVIAEIDPSDGALIDSGRIDLEQPLVTDDPIGDSILAAVQPMMSRNGDYINIAWLERVDSGATDESGLWVAEYRTTRASEDGSVTIPPLSETLSAPINVSPDVDGEQVNWFLWQNGLGYRCGIQSDAAVMNVFFEQSSGAFDELNSVRIVADLEGSSTSPATTTALLETFENGDQPGAPFLFAFVNLARNNFDATDSGEGGNFISFYVRDIDATVVDDFRLFAERTGSGAGVVEIDSSVSHRQAPDQLLTVVALPRGREFGAFDAGDNAYSDAAHHPAHFVHILFLEDNTTESSPNGDALRTRVFDAQSEAALGDAFTPNAGKSFQEPFSLGIPGADPVVLLQPRLLGSASSGESFGIWFTELRRIYYQEWHPEDSGEDSVGWHVADGASDPFLVDDDNDIEVSFPFGVYKRNGACDDLGCAMVFWTKQLDDNAGNERLQVRIRNED